MGENRRPTEDNPKGPRRGSQEETTLIAGRHPVREALKAGKPLHRILLKRGVEPRLVQEMHALARSAGVPVQVVDGRRLDILAAGLNHQGVVALGLARGYQTLDELLEQVARSGRAGLLLLLDGIQDPHNLGSLLRSCDAAGAHGVVVPQRRSVGLTAAVARASAGAVEHVPVARVVNLARAMEDLKDAGFWLVGADMDGDQLPWEVDLTGPVGLVIGGEGEGISRLVKKRCDYLVRLPMRGKVASLNAGVAGALLLFEAVRQRWPH